uniref:G_PROTEIN_RECEP_F1_2 domain-containing protein n=1 Tax=Panagrellus redivivus TaxID=6233 RepID=A0A7E4VGN8_PANRE
MEVADNLYDDVFPHRQTEHIQMMHSTGCLTIFLEPHMWFIAMFEIILSLFGMVFNCAIVVATYYSTPISVIQRRSMAMLSANYALISGLHLARNCFYIFAIHNPCITIVTTINCKLQEFPLVFLYLHGAIVPIVIAVQAFLKHKDNYQTITWTNACTINQTIVIVMCIVLSLLFTAFDDDKVEKHLLQCSIVLAIQQKEIAFCLITALIAGHTLALITMQIATSCSTNPIDLRHFLNHSLRDLLAIESIAWGILLLFTGVFAVYEFIALSICERCLSFALELTFIILPLCVCCLNPLLVIWIVLPVRNAATRLCPKLRSVLPEYDMPTPPLPSPEEVTCASSLAVEKEKQPTTK